MNPQVLSGPDFKYRSTAIDNRGKEMAKGFSLTIRAHDGSTMLQTNVDYIHQAFQKAD